VVVCVCEREKEIRFRVGMNTFAKVDMTCCSTQTTVTPQLFQASFCSCCKAAVVTRSFCSKTGSLCIYSTIPYFCHIMLNHPLIVLK